MDVRLITPDGVWLREPDELPDLLAGPGIVWIDIPAWDEQCARLLAEQIGLHPRTAADCAERNPVPKMHVYRNTEAGTPVAAGSEHVFVVLHGPERGAQGHVHYLELDQLIGQRYLVTVHGPFSANVDPAAAQNETASVVAKLESGRLRPTTPVELSFAVVTALTNRMRTYLTALTTEVWQLEQTVTGGHRGNPEQFLEELFQVRHGLLAVRTMCVLSREVYGRMHTLGVFDTAGTTLVTDLEDQFGRVAAMADGQREYLQGVIEFYQTRTNTKMTIAAERLAVIAAVTLPVTAVSSIVGMNVIVNDATQPGPLVLLLSGMAVMSAALLVWAKRKGWW